MRVGSQQHDNILEPDNPGWRGKLREEGSEERQILGVIQGPAHGGKIAAGTGKVRPLDVRMVAQPRRHMLALVRGVCLGGGAGQHRRAEHLGI